MLDGVGDLPHPDLSGKTPLEAATTKNMDMLAKNGIMGQVISVGKGIAPESDIAVFNMLGYKFQHSDYAGRGVVEAIGIGIDFKDGDLALRGNFATLDNEGKIIDRRAGRKIEREDVEEISKEIEKEIKFLNPNASVVVAPTVGHRVTVRLRDSKPLSSEISNTDPAYGRVDGMGIAKAVSDFMKIEKCIPLEQTKDAISAANLVNEFTEQSLEIMKKSDVNKRRSQKNTYNAGGLTDYEEKASVAAQAMETENAIYVHLKGPDEFGHDGDAIGKMKNIEEIDKRFFGTLLDHIDVSKVAVMISADHSTPSIHKGHSADPVPVLISGDMITNDDTQRFTETEAKNGAIGLIEGAQVVKTGIDLFKT